jgi:hypothetical protein
MAKDDAEKKEKKNIEEASKPDLFGSMEVVVGDELPESPLPYHSSDDEVEDSGKDNVPKEEERDEEDEEDEEDEDEKGAESSLPWRGDKNKLIQNKKTTLSSQEEEEIVEALAEDNIRKFHAFINDHNIDPNIKLKKNYDLPTTLLHAAILMSSYHVARYLAKSIMGDLSEILHFLASIPSFSKEKKEFIHFLVKERRVDLNYLLAGLTPIGTAYQVDNHKMIEVFLELEAIPKVSVGMFLSQDYLNSSIGTQLEKERKQPADNDDKRVKEGSSSSVGSLSTNSPSSFFTSVSSSSSTSSFSSPVASPSRNSSENSSTSSISSSMFYSRQLSENKPLRVFPQGVVEIIEQISARLDEYLDGADRELFERLKDDMLVATSVKKIYDLFKSALHEGTFDGKKVIQAILQEFLEQTPEDQKKGNWSVPSDSLSNSSSASEYSPHG